MGALPNVKWEIFCQSMLLGKEKYQCALDAGYKPSAARSTASHLLDKELVKARIQELQEASASAKIMSVRERKERLSEIARANITDFVSANGVIDVDGRNPHKGAVEGFSTKVKYSGKGFEPECVTDLKLHSPIDAIRELNKMEKVYEEGSGNTTINDNRKILNVVVVSDKARELTERICGGELPGAQVGTQNH